MKLAENLLTTLRSNVFAIKFSMPEESTQKYAVFYLTKWRGILSQLMFGKVDFVSSPKQLYISHNSLKTPS